MKNEPFDVASADQAIATMVDLFPALWYGLYKQCVMEGFTEDQAFNILLTYVASSSASSKG